MSVVATFSILGDLVREVGGDAVEVTTFVGPDSDAHTYQPKPTDARALAGRQGAGEQRPGLRGLDRSPLRGGRGLLAHIVGLRPVRRPKAIPHCWQDVACTRRYVANIADGLAAADPTNAALYHARAVAYDEKLATLDAWIRREIAKCAHGATPGDHLGRHLVLGYFARAYDRTLQRAPTGYSTDAEPTARDVANLIRQVREQKTRALFIENMTNPALVTEIARDSGAVVGPRLYSDALSKPDGPAPTYEAMMRHNVTALVAGMQKN